MNSPEVSVELNHVGSASLVMRLIDNLMSRSMLALLEPCLKLNSSCLIQYRVKHMTWLLLWYDRDLWTPPMNICFSSNGVILDYCVVSWTSYFCLTYPNMLLLTSAAFYYQYVFSSSRDSNLGAIRVLTAAVSAFLWWLFQQWNWLWSFQCKMNSNRAAYRDWTISTH